MTRLKQIPQTTCPHCGAQWLLRVNKPVRCPRCGRKL